MKEAVEIVLQSEIKAPKQLHEILGAWILGALKP
jgi:hypothetical protein